MCCMLTITLTLHKKAFDTCKHLLEEVSFISIERSYTDKLKGNTIIRLYSLKEEF